MDKLDFNAYNEGKKAKICYINIVSWKNFRHLLYFRLQLDMKTLHYNRKSLNLEKKTIETNF